MRIHEALLKLATWFERQKRVLPWRDDPTLYRVWVSEIMLQQTQVSTVVPYFEKFMSRFPTLEKLAEASQEEVMLYWAGLGYYSRARNLHQGARQIQHPGRFPRNREEWLEIPGVGEYTAGAILSIALDLPEPILDGNVERVLSRVRKVPRTERYKERLWRLSRILVEKAREQGIRPSVLNQSLMELGATLCTPKSPRCLLCPLASLCRAHQAGCEQEFPLKKKPKEWVKVEEELHCWIDAEGRVLLRQRATQEWRAGLWDFPEQSPPALAKKVGVVETRHVVTRHKVTRKTHVWACKALTAAEAGRMPSDDFRWVESDKPDVAVGSACRRVLSEIKKRKLIGFSLDF